MGGNMRTINISQDIIPVGEFKTGISKWLRSIRDKKHPVVITQNGRPAAVLITPEEYDKLTYTKIFTESINRGINDITMGDVYTTSEIKDKVKEFRTNR